ncbi:hypothetical protein WT60_00885 [Burkholderia sp. MSMB617WGS]|nr:hypothetical protein WS86_01275 [Burkholderia savannae]AOK45568.1 hypothetical protein WT60_00885 [Burkholderia sp. MSMB617WGS]OAB11325.1 hypothetical protein AQ853_29885 [Burkholderia pseudomallei]
MEPYKNLSGKSGVIAYEISTDSIEVEFKGSILYLYNYSTPGQRDVEQMKRHAIAGVGLNSYINTYVGKRYAQKRKRP